MKRNILKLFSLLVLSMISLQVLSAQDDRLKTLKVYNWADYIDESLLSEFESWYQAETGESVKVIYETFDVNENMLTKIEMGHEDYDVVCPSEYIIERMLRNKLLLPIQREFGSTPDYISLVSPFAAEKFEQMGDGKIRVSDYAVGYMWGTTGFLYNTELVDRSDVETWGALLNPKFRQRILMKEAYRDVYSAIICYANYSEILAGNITRDELVGEVNDDRIRQVEKVLIQAKPNFFGWEVDFGKEMMTQQKAWLNLTWSGDATWAIEEAAEVGVNLDYVVPQEGSNVWFDGWVIPKFARNIKAASYFINFMCMPENAIRNMEEIGYVSVVASPEVMESVSDTTIHETYDISYFFGEGVGADSLHVNPVLYPDRSVISRCALMHDCADKTEAMLSMWSRIKGDNLDSKMIFLILVVLCGLLVAFVYKKIGKKKKKTRKRMRR